MHMLTRTMTAMTMVSAGMPISIASAHVPSRIFSTILKAVNVPSFATLKARI